MRYSPYIIFFLVILLIFLAVYGDDSYAKLKKIEKQYAEDKQEQAQLEDSVKALKREVWSLKKDNREIERAARNNHAMARPDEKVFFFKD